MLARKGTFLPPSWDYKRGRHKTEKQRRKRLGSDGARHTGTRKTQQWNTWFYVQLVSKYLAGI